MHLILLLIKGKKIHAYEVPAYFNIKNSILVKYFILQDRKLLHHFRAD